MSEDRSGPATAWSNRLRAGVLGANDGIVSTAALAVGIAAAATTRAPVVLTVTAGVIAGASSMAVGEYVSVSSARDAQRADLDRERAEHRRSPQEELAELAALFEARGASPEVARAVAADLTEADALGAHAREELGITEQLQARPTEAAVTSAVAFLTGAAIPLLAVLFAPIGAMVATIAAATLTALVLLGLLSAGIAGADRRRAVLRIAIGASLAMGVTLVGSHLLGIEL
jgi:vacuolar iron transporter family protein